MATDYIGINEFRKNLTKYAKQIAAGKGSIVVVRRDIPVMKITTYKQPKTKSVSYTQYVKDLRQALRDSKKGPYYTTDEVRQMLGIPKKK